MSRITKAGMLTERDTAILTDLSRLRLASFEQIKREYWPHAKDRTCEERLLRLEKAGYLHQATVPAETPGRTVDVYYLGEKGRRETGAPSLFARGGNLAEAIHQVRANEIYFSLSEKEKATWTIGEVLEAEGRKVPDASYVAESGEAVYVEADTGSYKRHHVEEKLRDFGSTSTIWVCPEGREHFLRGCGVAGRIVTYRY